MADPIVVPVVAEDLSVSKTSHVTGRVTVRTATEEVTEWVAAELASEHVDVERVAIGREVSAVPPTRVEGDVTIIPVVEERVVLQKQLFLREEIHVRKRTDVESMSTPVIVRKQQVLVERSGEPKPHTKDD